MYTKNLYKIEDFSFLDADKMRPIPGFEGYYLAHEDGRIFSLKSGSFRNPRKEKNGYLRLCLCKETERSMVLVHRIIAKTFIKNDQNKRTVNHKNGNKTDNRIENLEWATHRENIHHTIHILKRWGRFGKRVKRA